MNITLSENGEIVVTSAYLASFAERKMKTERLPFTPVFAKDNCISDIFTEPTVRLIHGGVVFIVTSQPDIIFTTPDNCTVEKIRCLKKLSASSNPYSDPRFLADCYVTAYTVCKKKNLSEIILRITLKADNGSKSFEIKLNSNYLSMITEGLISRCLPFAKAEKDFLSRGVKDIIEMPFPFSSARDGQKDLIKSVYRCAAKGKRLIALAPTGIGKTVSVLYPAIKAVGSGIAEKVFYLTAKTVTGKAALDTVRMMNSKAPDLRAISIVAKERICPSKDKKNPFVQEKCSYNCPRLSDEADASYSKRQRAALSELLSGARVYEKGDIKTVAEKYRVCPYELSLDLSEYCSVIVCDYNYVFDARVRFRRYFAEGNLKYILLADEAHNLPDRTREMYSAEISLAEFKKLSDMLKEKLPFGSSLSEPVGKVIEAFETVRRMCIENSSMTSEGAYGYSISNHIPGAIINALEKLKSAVFKASEQADDEELEKELERISSLASDFVSCAGYFDEHFVLFSELRGDEITAKIMCLDPSAILDRYMSGAVSSVLFSATLTPTDYFADILGCRDAEILELESPYSEDNFCLAAVDTISTKYSSRRDTVDSVADIILTTVEAKSGNYIVYCPSYKYMDAVVKAFLSVAPKEIKAVAQKSGMSIDQGKKFLSFFENHKEGETLVGFCVMGGSFSEGIDLPRDMLIGTVLVGMGLPTLSSELNVMKDYFDRTREDGYNFAYLYPAMIKILQAAGRVIRSEDDRGVAVLIDDRYRDPAVRKLFPSHWRKIHYIGDSYSLSKYLERFWNNQ